MNSRYPPGTTVLLTQHGVCLGTHSVVEGPDVPDLLLGKRSAAVLREGGVIVHGVHGSHGQPFWNRDEIPGYL